MAYIGNVPAELVTELDNGVVTTDKLANDAVTAAKIIDGTIISDDLNDGIITNSKVAASAAIAASKLAISGGSNITLQSDGTFDLDNTVSVTALRVNTSGTAASLVVGGDTDGEVTPLQLRNDDNLYSQSWSFSLDTSKDLVITGASGSGGVKFAPGSRGVDVSAGPLKVGGSSVVDASRNAYITSLEVRGAGNATNRFNLSYNSTSGIATVGPNSTGGNTTFALGTSNAGTYATKLTVKHDGNVNIDSGGLQIGGSTAIDSSRNYTGPYFASSANVNSSGESGLQIYTDRRLGFDESGVRSWNLKATGGSLVVTSGDGNGGFDISGPELKFGGTTVLEQDRDLKNIRSFSIVGDSTSGGVKNNISQPGTGGGDYSIMVTSDANGSLSGGKFAILDNAVSGNNLAQTRFIVDGSGNIAQGGTTTIGHNYPLSGGTTLYVKKKDSSTNLQRWGEGTNLNSADSYKWRLDQNFNFIANDGTSDVITMNQSQGSINVTGGYSVGGTTAIDSARRFFVVNLQNNNPISFLNGSNGVSGSGAQGINVRHIYAGTSYADSTAGAGDIEAKNSFKLAGTTVIDSNRLLQNVAVRDLSNDPYAPYISPTNANTINAQRTQDNDTADLWINYRGYNDGHTRFRDFRVGDGKGVELIHVDGSERTIDFAKGMEAIFWRPENSRSSSIFHDSGGMKIRNNHDGDNIDFQARTGRFVFTNTYSSSFATSSAIMQVKSALTTTGATRMLGIVDGSGNQKAHIAYSHDYDDVEILASESNGGVVIFTGGLNKRVIVNSNGTTHFAKGLSGRSIKIVNLTNSFQNILAVDGALGSQGGGYCICATHENSYRQGWILTYSNNGGIRVHYLGGDEYHTHSKDVAFQYSNGYLQARRVNYTTGRPLEIFQVHGAFTADYD